MFVVSQGSETEELFLQLPMSVTDGILVSSIGRVAEGYSEVSVVNSVKWHAVGHAAVFCRAAIEELPDEDIDKVHSGFHPLYVINGAIAVLPNDSSLRRLTSDLPIPYHVRNFLDRQASVSSAQG